MLRRFINTAVFLHFCENKVMREWKCLRAVSFPLADLSFGLPPSIKDRVLCSGILLYLHHRNSKLFFHPAKIDNFKDETISDYITVSVTKSQILAGLKTLGLVGL